MAESNSENNTAEDGCNKQPKYTVNKTSLLRSKFTKYDATVFTRGIKGCRFTLGGESKHTIRY